MKNHRCVGLSARLDTTLVLLLYIAVLFLLFLLRWSSKGCWSSIRSSDLPSVRLAFPRMYQYPFTSSVWLWSPFIVIIMMLNESMTWMVWFRFLMSKMIIGAWGLRLAARVKSCMALRSRTFQALKTLHYVWDPLLEEYSGQLTIWCSDTQFQSDKKHQEPPS
jgi:hypothetical protein